MLVTVALLLVLVDQVQAVERGNQGTVNQATQEMSYSHVSSTLNFPTYINFYLWHIIINHIPFSHYSLLRKIFIKQFAVRLQVILAGIWSLMTCENQASSSMPGIYFVLWGWCWSIFQFLNRHSHAVEPSWRRTREMRESCSDEWRHITRGFFADKTWQKDPLKTNP